jgi:hypothetical protein
MSKEIPYEHFKYISTQTPNYSRDGSNPSRWASGNGEKKALAQLSGADMGKKKRSLS